MKKQGRSGRPGAAGEARAGGQGAHFRNIDSIPDPRPAGRGALGFCPAHPEELGTNCWSPLRRRREEAPLLVGPWADQICVSSWTPVTFRSLHPR